MKLGKYRKLLNFAWYQSIWFLAILGGETFEPLLAALLLAHVLACRDWQAEAKLMIACATMGIGVDSILYSQGLYIFAEAPILLPIPLWLMCLWLGFAGTLRHSMSYLVNRPRLACVAASVAAPFSYFAGERFGAVSFALDDQATAITIGLSWALLMIAFTRLARWHIRPAESAETHTVFQQV